MRPLFRARVTGRFGIENSWNDDDCVVIPHQAAIAVYFNLHGDLVIRQEGHYGPDEDPNGSSSRRKICFPLIPWLQEMSGEL